MKKTQPEAKRKPQRKHNDDFVSVARRLGADEDKATFEAKLAKIVKVTPSKERKG